MMKLFGYGMGGRKGWQCKWLRVYFDSYEHAFALAACPPGRTGVWVFCPDEMDTDRAEYQKKQSRDSLRQAMHEVARQAGHSQQQYKVSRADFEVVVNICLRWLHQDTLEPEQLDELRALMGDDRAAHRI